jgi:hypothetical protein
MPLTSCRGSLSIFCCMTYLTALTILSFFLIAKLIRSLGLSAFLLNLALVCFCFSDGFFSRKAEKPKAETNNKLFNWLLER